MKPSGISSTDLAPFRGNESAPDEARDGDGEGPAARRFGRGSRGEDDGSIGVLLHLARRRFKSLVADAVAPLGLTPRQFLVLSGLVRREALAQRQLGRREGVDRTTMTQVIDRLAKRGLVERVSNQADRRAFRLVATDAGRALIQDAGDRILSDVEAALLSPLTGDERGVLRQLLGRIAYGRDETPAPM